MVLKEPNAYPLLVEVYKAQQDRFRMFADEIKEIHQLMDVSVVIEKDVIKINLFCLEGKWLL